MFKSGFGLVDLKAELLAFAMWLTAALVLSTAASACLNHDGLTMREIGLWSSALSFIAAALSGAAAIRIRKKQRLITGLFTGVILTLVLISLGYMIVGNDINSSGIVSVTMFTLSGCLAGAVFCPTGKIRSVMRKKVDIKL